MSVTIPATGSGSATPVVATESADGSVVAGATDNIQQFSLVNLFVQFKNALNILAQTLALSVDPGTGRLRVLLDPSGGAQTIGTVTTVTTISGATVTNISATAGGGNKPDTMIFDAMQTAWASSNNPCIARI